MKALKVILKIVAVLAILSGILLLVAAYLDKLRELYARRGELKEKAISLKEKLPTKQSVLNKLPTKEDMIRLNPFRRTEIEAEYADYVDVK